jgi:hypothetical protein
MIVIDLPENIDNDFIKLIPMQRAFTDRMMKEDIIAEYSLSYDRSKLWVVMRGENLNDIHKKLSKFPIYNYIKYSIHNLLFHESNIISAPQLWLN